jgi:hypothetical protein
MNNIDKRLWWVAGFVAVAILASALFSLLAKRYDYYLVNSNTQDGGGYSLLHQVELEFSQTLSQGFVESCTATWSPSATSTIFASDKILVIQPTPRLSPLTTYNLTVKCGDKTNITLRFSTLGEESLSEEELGILQSQRDYEFGKNFEEAYKEKPWLEKLPLLTKEFDVVYAQTTNSFIALSKLPPGSKKTRTQLETEIKTQLKELGAPDLPIIWR